MTGTPGWAGIPDGGETILWQERSQGGSGLHPANIKAAMPGTIITLFEQTWTSMAMTAPGLLWLFGLTYPAIGLSTLARPALFADDGLTTQALPRPDDIARLGFRNIAETCPVCWLMRRIQTSNILGPVDPGRNTRT